MVSGTSCLSFFCSTSCTTAPLLLYFLPKWSILFRNLYRIVGRLLLGELNHSTLQLLEQAKNYSLSLIFSENMFEICSTMLGKGIIRLCCFLGQRKYKKARSGYQKKLKESQRGWGGVKNVRRTT